MCLHAYSQVYAVLSPHADTPLGMACGRKGHVECVVPLLSAGAHIDFRGKDALTALHRAAIGGNEKATNVSSQCVSMLCTVVRSH